MKVKGVKHYESKVMPRFSEGGAVGSVEDQMDARNEDLENYSRKSQKGLSTSGEPVIVRTNGKYDPAATGRMIAKNYIEGVNQKIDPSESAKARAAKNKKDDD